MFAVANKSAGGKNSNFSVSVVGLYLRLQMEAEGTLKCIAEMTQLPREMVS